MLKHVVKYIPRNILIIRALYVFVWFSTNGSTWGAHQHAPVCHSAYYQIRKIAGCASAGNAENVSPATAGLRSRHASRHVRVARAVMYAGIANYRFLFKSVAGNTFPAFPAHAQSTILRIWQEAHASTEVDDVATTKQFTDQNRTYLVWNLTCL